MSDVRYALRGMRKYPGFTLVAVTSLMLGIGLNTAVFSVVDAVLFRPMPVAAPESLVSVFTGDDDDPTGTTSWADFQDLRDANSVFTDMVGYSMMMGAVGAGGSNQLVVGEVVTANYFDALGIVPAIGRGFRPDEEVGEGAHPVAVLSHGLWQSQFGGREDVVGSPIVIRNRTYTVVGVAPPDFPGLIPSLETALWIPVSMVDDVEPITLNTTTPSPGETRLERRGHRWLFALGRLRPGTSAAAAEANLDAVMARLATEYPVSNESRGAHVLPAADVRVHPMLDASLRPGGLVILGAVSLVLLVACANLASLLLARGVSRAKELALRAALGADRRRLIRQMLVENLVLSLVGGVAGVALASWALRWVATIRPPLELAMPLSFGIDLRVLAFALVVSAATGVAIGLLPAIRSSRTNLVRDLKADAQAGGAIGRGFSLGKALVVVQVAVSLVLVVSGVLLTRSLVAARDIDPGFDADPLALVSINLGFHGYSDADAAQFFDRAMDRLPQLPGIEAVGLSVRMPFSPNVHQATIAVDGRPDATARGGDVVDTTRVSPGYFDAMGLPILEGRVFDARDTAEAADVAIVNRTLAERYWPGQSAVGQRLRYRDQSGPAIEVVGVVRDHKVRTLGEDPRPLIHFARSQSAAPFGTFVARTAGDPAEAVSAIRGALLTLDPNIVMMEARPYADLIAFSLLPVTIGASLIGGLAALAMLLAGLGLYGVIAFGVSRRTREVGIRMALGADRRQVIVQVLREAAVLVTLGSVLGFALAALGGRALGAVLHVPALDPVSYLLSALLLAAATLVAAGIPARRAARLDPLVALRSS